MLFSHSGHPKSSVRSPVLWYMHPFRYWQCLSPRSCQTVTELFGLLFFIGILFAVGALGYLGILDMLSGVIFGENPAVWRLIFGSVFLGAISAILDNIPLTAAAMDIMQTTDFRLWVLLAICVGTGGSMLIIGSAAGVVAMGMVKELSFKQYLKIATFPAAIGYAAGVLVWYLQYLFF